MNTVWVAVYEHPEEPTELLGVYKTPEKARERVESEFRERYPEATWVKYSGLWVCYLTGIEDVDEPAVFVQEWQPE